MAKAKTKTNGNEKTIVHLHRWEKSDPKVKVKLMKMSKGFNWEISIDGIAANEAEESVLLGRIEGMNQKMLEKYYQGGESNGR